MDATAGPRTGHARLLVDVSGGGRGTPTLSIDGQPPAVLRWGQNAFELPAGRHHLRASVGIGQALHWGHADLTVTTWPEHTTTVYYRTPITTTARGAIGLTPQPLPGLRFLLAVLVPSVLLMFVLLLAIVIG